MTPRRLILVTGSPRSGTTAVGQMLALGRGVCALHEPLNYHSGLCDVARYFEVPGAAGFTDERLGRLVSAIRDLRVRFKTGIFPGDGTWRRMAKRIVGGRSRVSCLRCRLTPGLRTIVWKDPFAAFLARDLALRHGVDVVVTARNPWAVAASFKRMNWRFDLADLGRRLASIGVDPAPALAAVRPPLDGAAMNGAAVWWLIYRTLLAWAAEASRIHFVNLDEIIAAPVDTYRRLYDRLALAWSPATAERIARAYAREGAAAIPRAGKAHDARRDFQAINTYWPELLGGDEAAAVGTLDGSLWEDLQQSSHAGIGDGDA